jgi:hypothetical protein
MSDGLRGFASFRTPNTMHPPTPAPTGVCSNPGCTTRLSAYNLTDTCCAHKGTYNIGPFMAALAEEAEQGQLNAVVSVVSGEAYMANSKVGRYINRDRDDLIRSFAAKGYTQYDLAKVFDMPRSTIADIIRKGGEPCATSPSH